MLWIFCAAIAGVAGYGCIKFLRFAEECYA